MKKFRLKALDGLRGFAALSVLFSHSGFEVANFSTNPVLIGIYRTLSVGPNSVQVLFVLCGFLISLLYSSVPSPITFIQKRYTRIFPIYATVCLFLFGQRLHILSGDWYQPLILLMGVAVTIHWLWKLIWKFDKTGKLSKRIFISFIILQIMTALFAVIIIPKISADYSIQLPKILRELVYFLTNVTITNSLAKNILPLSGVFWSLAPEIIFYLVFPFVVTPLIALSKRLSVWAIGLIILSLIKVLFDLDFALYAFGSALGLNIARASGFLVGTVIGTIYKNQGQTWLKLSKLFSLKWINILVIGLFFLSQWGDWTWRSYLGNFGSNWYFLGSSIVIGMVIIGAVKESTLINRLLSHKLLIVVGMISYSMYLIHPHISEMFNKIAMSQILYLVLYVGSAFIVSYCLYWLIERMYFVKKTTSFIPKQKSLEITNPWFGQLMVVMVVLILFAGTYSPSLLVNHHLPRKVSSLLFSEESLLEHPVTVPFTATNDDLAIVTMQLRYRLSADKLLGSSQSHAKLIFRLYDDQQQLLFESVRDAYTIEGEPHYPFGFPIQSNSKGKNYSVELSLISGSINDQILVVSYPGSLVTEYLNTKGSIGWRIGNFLINRLKFVITNPNAVFFLGFVSVVAWKIRKKLLFSHIS